MDSVVALCSPLMPSSQTQVPPPSFGMSEKQYRMVKAVLEESRKQRYQSLSEWKLDLL